MDDSFHQRINNDFASLHELMEKTTHFLESRAVDERGVYLVNFGLEEIITNIVKYGYDAPGPYHIDVTLKLYAEEVEVTIVDDGHAFDPLAQERKMPAASIEDREVGGLGLHLLKKLIDRVEYRRQQGRNIVELKVRREQAQP